MQLKRWALIGLVVLCTVACRKEENPRPNVLLISIDTLRADHCSVSGYDRPTTPRLEALAGEGTRVDNAYAPTATTGPTHATLFTSLYPIAHGLVKNGLLLHEDFQTLAETLRDAGFRTGAIASSYVLDGKFGYGQGFDVYDDDFDAQASTWKISEWQGQPLEGGFDQPANLATDKAIRWLDGRDDARPFFLFVHYFDPHAPYVPPEPFASRFASAGSEADELRATIDAYDAEIAFTDHELGRLLDHLKETGLEQDTLVLVTADHGEGLMQHGHPFHGVHIYEEGVRVPLLARLPGRIGAGQVLDGPVELLDLAPTILELVGMEFPPAYQGRSLAAALTGAGALDPQREVFLHRRHYEPGMVGEIAVHGEKFGIRQGPWKYILGVEENSRELFDLTEDPGEQVNLYDTNQAKALELEAKISAWKLTHGREAPAQPELSEEERERLGALGYVQ